VMDVRELVRRAVLAPGHRGVTVEDQSRMRVALANETLLPGPAFFALGPADPRMKPGAPAAAEPHALVLLSETRERIPSRSIKPPDRILAHCTIRSPAPVSCGRQGAYARPAWHAPVFRGSLRVSRQGYGEQSCRFLRGIRESVQSVGGLLGSTRRLRGRVSPHPRACVRPVSPRGRRTSPRRRSACAAARLAPLAKSSCRELPACRRRTGVQTIGRVSEARREPHPKARSLGSSGDASFLLFIPFCEKDHARLRQVFGNVP